MNDKERLTKEKWKRGVSGRWAGKLILGLLAVGLCCLIGAAVGLPRTAVLQIQSVFAQTSDRMRKHRKPLAAYRAASSPEKEEAASQPLKSGTCILANRQFTNLRPDDVTKPVYDRRTLEERMAGNLPLEFPPISFYTEKKVAYLTFDDGPDRVNTPKILDILEEYGVPATFYVLGCRAEQNPDVLQRIFHAGHAVGNHSFNHDYEALYASTNEFLWQIIHTEEIIRDILGVRPLIVRAPGGTAEHFTQDYWRMMETHGYAVHDWNVCTNDSTGERPDAARQLAYVTEQIGRPLKDDAAIVLMHCVEDKEETVKALPKIIELLKAEGYTFGVVSPMTPQPY